MDNQWLKAFDIDNIFKIYQKIDLTSYSQLNLEDEKTQIYIIDHSSDRPIWEILKSLKSISEIPHPWLNRSYSGEYSPPDISIKSYL